MNTTLELIELSTVADVGADKCHVTCLRNDDRSLCGIDLAEEDWVDSEPQPNDCESCADFERTDFCAHCAMGES